MKTKKCILGAIFFMCLSAVAQKTEELDEVVITDSKFELKRENSGKVVVKITQEELERNQGKSVATLINSISGIEINGTRSNAGQPLSYFVRGGNNRQVLILIDGVQLSDPSQLANDFDLRLLDINTIQSIEIIKGAASTLYGSGAATAVINITTKKAATKTISANFMSVAGTNESQSDRNFSINDFQNSVSINGTAGKFSYIAGFGNQYTDGLSAVNDLNTFEKDPFSRYGANVKLGYSFSENIAFNLYGNYDHFDVAYDNSFPLENAPFTSKSEQKRIGISSKWTYGKGSLTLNGAINAINRSFDSNFPAQFESHSYVVDAFHKYVFADVLHTVAGLNTIQNQTEFGESQKTTTVDPYLNIVYVSEFGLNVNAGTRLNNHSEYGSQLTYHLNPSFTYEWEGNYAKVFGSIATSFIAPSLSQLYGDFGANPNLDPERDRTFEGGVEFSSAKNFRISTTYFNRREKDFIDYVVDYDTFAGEYQNVNQNFTITGVEVEVNGTIWDEVHLRANYTFTENRDKVVLRIPKHKANIMAGWDISAKSFFSLNYQYVDSRTDTDFMSFENVELEAFGTWDSYFSHKVLKNKLKLFLGVSNIFNTQYQELFGYTTRGRNIRAGFNLKL